MSAGSVRRAHAIHVYKGVGSIWVVTSGRRTLSRHWTRRTAATWGARFRSKDSYGNESSRRDRER